MAHLTAMVLVSLIGADISEHAVVRESVDLIELNHFIDRTGQHIFDQVIFYDWDVVDQQYHVRAWRLVKSAEQLPSQHWLPPHYRCVWCDNRTFREVCSERHRETWSSLDPERENRKLLPEALRADLRKPGMIQRR